MKTRIIIRCITISFCFRDDLSSLGDPFAVTKQEVKSPVKNVSGTT